MNAVAIRPISLKEEDMGGFSDLWSSYGFYNDTSFDIGGPIMPSEQQFSEFADDMQVDTISAAIQSLYNPIAPAEEVEQILDSLVPENSELLRSNDQQSSADLSLLDLLSNHQPIHNRLNVKKINALTDREDQQSGGGMELSTEDIMRIAAACFIQMSSPADNNPYMLRNPFGLSIGGLSAGGNESIELANLLLSAAEKTCGFSKENPSDRSFNPPWGSVDYFDASIGDEKLMSINNVKISAIGTSEEAINTTGKRLISFAESLSLPFIFKAVIVPDVKDLKDNMFDVEEGEAISVYSSMDTSYMIVRPDRLETVMRVIRKLRPCIMTVAEVEAKHNSPSLINRFTEALFYFSAFFDCIGSCMEVDTDRKFVEERFCSQGIRSIIATEGSERLVRHVGISVWRSFFTHYQLVEAELNQWSFYQASLLVKQFVNGNSYTLEKNGKALLVGWKGTPLHFLSAWKFQ
ncbi:protein SLENDER RICE1-LIKE 2-like [Typha latifolia]|uniref:protein SLENDER RICE1-LIKE 2-like n=1 Tax=Typha latifolia TaxID=4733 RepID=UPI003C2ED87E